MDRTIFATVDAAPAKAIAALADLSTYPVWLSLVALAEPQAEDAVWSITLRARLGPLARSKRLRMARTALDDHHVRFERRETDGRTHAEWTLTTTVETIGENRCEVKVHLHYGGALWTAPLEIILNSFESEAAERLTEYLKTR